MHIGKATLAVGGRKRTFYMGYHESKGMFDDHDPMTREELL